MNQVTETRQTEYMSSIIAALKMHTSPDGSLPPALAAYLERTPELVLGRSIRPRLQNCELERIVRQHLQRTPMYESLAYRRFKAAVSRKTSLTVTPVAEGRQFDLKSYVQALNRLADAGFVILEKRLLPESKRFEKLMKRIVVKRSRQGIQSCAPQYFFIRLNEAVKTPDVGLPLM